MLEIGVIKFLDGTPFHLKYSSSRTSHFVPHQKAPSPKIITIHQFTFKVDRFHSFWHVDLSQWVHGSKKLCFP